MKFTFTHNGKEISVYTTIQIQVTGCKIDTDRAGCADWSNTIFLSPLGRIPRKVIRRTVEDVLIN